MIKALSQVAWILRKYVNIDYNPQSNLSIISKMIHFQTRIYGVLYNVAKMKIFVNILGMSSKGFRKKYIPEPDL